MEDWDWMVHWILLKRHYRQWVPICQTRRHALPGTVGWVFLSALKANTDSTLCDATPMCNVETLGRAIAAYIGVRARTPRPWRSQHLWQRGGKWQWWWTSWDRGSPLGSQARCAAGKKVKCEQPKAKVGWGVSSRDPNVTEFMTYRPYSQVELADLGKQVQQTHRKHLEAWLLWLWDTGWARHLRGFAGPYWEKPWRRKWQPHSSPLSWKIPRTEEPGRLQSMGSLRVGHDWATTLHFTSLREVERWHAGCHFESAKPGWMHETSARTWCTGKT